MSAVDSALSQALADAAESNAILRARAWHTVSALQRHIQQDGGKRLLKAADELAPLIATWAGRNGLTPGEAALALSSYMVGLLVALPGCSPELARAIAVELAGGPRSE